MANRYDAEWERRYDRERDEPRRDRQQAGWGEGERWGQQDWQRENRPRNAERGDWGRQPESGWQGRREDRPEGAHPGGGPGRESEYGHEASREWRGRQEGWGGGSSTGYGRDVSQGEFEASRHHNWGQGSIETEGSGYRGPFGGQQFGQHGQFGGQQNYMGGVGTFGPQRGRYAGKGPKGYRRSDERIREEINERLTEHHEIDATDIDVQVQNSEVTLTGFVPEREMKRLAEDVAERTGGVQEVHNQLRVQSQVHTGRAGAGPGQHGQQQ